MNTYKKELFEIVRERLNCDYVSDLRVEPYRHKAIDVMHEMNLKQFSLVSLEDMAEYVSDKDVKFDDYAEAETFFHS